MLTTGEQRELRLLEEELIAQYGTPDDSPAGKA